MYVHPATYRCGRSDIAYLCIQSIRGITLMKSNHGTFCWFNAVAIVRILCLEEGSDCTWCINSSTTWHATYTSSFFFGCISTVYCKEDKVPLAAAEWLAGPWKQARASGIESIDSALSSRWSCDSWILVGSAGLIDIQYSDDIRRETLGGFREQIISLSFSFLTVSMIMPVTNFKLNDC